ncbi:MAG: hypothetical protein KA311_00220 [Sediminibacterium sp.]|nr:hypothetical protein [Sediminibacterium sp.]MBP7939509.1 hypothetical protein [Sediminibacterium sp.]
MKKQTAVEWLVNELVKKGFPIGKYGMDSYEQAKEMEKQQIEDAYDEGYFDQKSAEQYYKDTFKNK